MGPGTGCTSQFSSWRGKAGGAGLHGIPFRASSIMALIMSCVKFRDKSSAISLIPEEKGSSNISCPPPARAAISTTRPPRCNLHCSPSWTGGEQARRRYSLIAENWLIQQREQSKSRTHCSQSETKHTGTPPSKKKALQNSIPPINSCHYGRLAKQKLNKKSSHCGFERSAESQPRCHGD